MSGAERPARAAIPAFEAPPFGARERALIVARRRVWRPTGAGALEISNAFLKADNLSPEAIAFVSELIDPFTQQQTLSDRLWSVSRVDQPGVALSLPCSVSAHPRCARRPLAGPAHSSLSAHDSRCCNGYVTNDYPSRYPDRYPTGSQRMMSIASSLLSAKRAISSWWPRRTS